MSAIALKDRLPCLVKIIGRAFAFLALGFAPSIYGQSFPLKPITLVVPYQAGGSSDAIARAMARLVGKTLASRLSLKIRRARRA